MTRILFVLPLFFISPFLYGQSVREYTLRSADIEALFLSANLKPLAGRLEIDMADAAIVQARAWENPSFSLHDLNLWSRSSQREGEQIPPLFGKVGKNTEFSLEWSQMIQTAANAGNGSVWSKAEKRGRSSNWRTAEGAETGIPPGLFRTSLSPTVSG